MKSISPDQVMKVALPGKEDSITLFQPQCHIDNPQVIMNDGTILEYRGNALVKVAKYEVRQ